MKKRNVRGCVLAGASPSLTGRWTDDWSASAAVGDSIAHGAGPVEFYCATCHGRDGKGNGPVAAALKVVPPDLTRLARDNGGAFPRKRVEMFMTMRNVWPRRRTERRTCRSGGRYFAGSIPRYLGRRCESTTSWIHRIDAGEVNRPVIRTPTSWTPSAPRRNRRSGWQWVVVLCLTVAPNASGQSFLGGGATVTWPAGTSPYVGTQNPSVPSEGIHGVSIGGVATIGAFPWPTSA